MSAVADALKAVKAALQLTDDVKKVGEQLKSLANTIQDHEKRLIRMETRWETAVQLSQINPNRPSRPPKLTDD